jgi:hypothetical protein
MGAMKEWAAETANDDLEMFEFDHYASMTELERAEHDCWVALSAAKNAIETLKRVRGKSHA